MLICSASIAEAQLVGPSCQDGIQNQGETAVDCGGPNCNPCGSPQPASTPFAAFLAGLDRADQGGDNTRIALIGDSNFDAPRAFYNPLRLEYERDRPAGGPGVATIFGFVIHDLPVSRTGNWSRLDDHRGLGERTQVSSDAGDQLLLRGTFQAGRFDRAIVMLDQLPGGGTVAIEALAGNTVLSTQFVDLDGPRQGVRVVLDDYTFQANNGVRLTTVDPGAEGVHVLGISCERKPAGAVQVYKLGVSGETAVRRWTNLSTTAFPEFFATLDQVVLNLGTNDMRTSTLELFEGNINAILGWFAERGVPVVVLAPGDMSPLTNPSRNFSEAEAREILKRLAAHHGAAYYDLAQRHGDYARVINEGIYRDDVHYYAWNLYDAAPLRHGRYLYNVLHGHATENRASIQDVYGDGDDSIAVHEACGPSISRYVDGSGQPEIVYFLDEQFDIVAGIGNDVKLGEVTLKSYLSSDAALRRDAGNNPYARRQIGLRSQLPGSARVYLPLTDLEWNELVAARGDLSSATQLEGVLSNLEACGEGSPALDSALQVSVQEVHQLADGVLVGLDLPSVDGRVQLRASISAPLPVTWDGGLAQREGMDVRLSWRSYWEEDLNHYSVQVRELDASNNDWRELKRVAAEGPREYRVVDERQPAAAYYRVVAVDLDGQQTQGQASFVQAASGLEGEQLRLSPNPVTTGDEVLLQRSDASRTQQLMVIDPSGRLVYATQWVEGQDTHRLQTTELLPGVYELRLGREVKARLMVL